MEDLRTVNKDPICNHDLPSCKYFYNRPENFDPDEERTLDEKMSQIGNTRKF